MTTKYCSQCLNHITARLSPKSWKCPDCDNLVCRLCMIKMIQDPHNFLCPCCPAIYDVGNYDESPKPVISSLSWAQAVVQPHSFRIGNQHRPLINVPADGSCFYHCLVKVLAPLFPDLNVSVDSLRTIVADNATQEDYDNHQMLCLVEEGTRSYASLDDYKYGIQYGNEFANMASIQIFMRLLGDQIALVIYNPEGDIISPKEWAADAVPVHTELVLLDWNHYQLIAT